MHAAEGAAHGDGLPSCAGAFPDEALWYFSDPIWKHLCFGSPELLRWSRPCRKKAAASRRILERVAEAFGVMMLDTGLFQADAHPGNILVMKGAATSAQSSALCSSIVNCLSLAALMLGARTGADAALKRLGLRPQQRRLTWRHRGHLPVMLEVYSPCHMRAHSRLGTTHTACAAVIETIANQ